MRFSLPLIPARQITVTASEGVGKPLRMATLLKLLLLLSSVWFGLDLLFDLPPNDLEFQWEEVSAECAEEKVLFRGVYGFYHNHPFRTRYELAFPISESEKPVRVSGFDLRVNGEKIDVVQDGNLFLCRLPLRPGILETVRLRYLVHPDGNRAEYVTRTAHDWRQPIKRATFFKGPGLVSNYHQGSDRVMFGPFLPTENWILHRR